MSSGHERERAYSTVPGAHIGQQQRTVTSHIPLTVTTARTEYVLPI